MVEAPFSEYFAEQPEPQRSTLETVATSLRAILPDAEACISYGVPAFKVDGTAVAGFAGLKHHCSYFPHSGDVLRRLTDELTGFDHNQGTLRFPVGAPLERTLLRKLVVARLQLESERVATDGTTRRFYDNGRVQSKGRTRDGELHGAWSWWRKDGSLMRTGEFRRGVKTGPWRTFDRAGEVVKETAF